MLSIGGIFGARGPLEVPSVIRLFLAHVFIFSLAVSGRNTDLRGVRVEQGLRILFRIFA